MLAQIETAMVPAMLAEITPSMKTTMIATTFDGGGRGDDGGEYFSFSWLTWWWGASTMVLSIEMDSKDKDKRKRQ